MKNNYRLLDYFCLMLMIKGPQSSEWIIKVQLNVTEETELENPFNHRNERIG